MDKWGEAYGEFYVMVGRCIAEWGEIEERLFNICWDCLGPYEQSAIVYYRTPSIDARLTLIDELIECVMSKEEIDLSGYEPTWKATIKLVRGLLSTRRQLAHHPIKEINNYLVYHTKWQNWAEGPVFRVRASEHERARGKRDDELYIDDLHEHHSSLEGAKLMLDQFLELFRMRRLESARPESLLSRAAVRCRPA
jgi:hypothetical protein